MPPPGKSPPSDRARSPKRGRWLWSALVAACGAALYLFAALLVFLVIEHALSRAAAVVAVLLTGVLAPLALTQLLTPAFRRLDPGATFLRVLPGVAGLCGLITLVALPLSARAPVSNALQGVASRYPRAGAVPVGAARLVGRALDPGAVDAGALGVVPPDAGVRDAGARDAGARDAAALDAVSPPTVVADVPVAPDVTADATADATADVTALADAAEAEAPVDASVVPDAQVVAGDEHTLAEVTACQHPRAVLLADLEGDARDEVVLQCASSVHVLALTEGTLAERLRFVPVAPPGLVAEVGRPAVFDMDGDGRRDVVLCEHHTTERGGGRGGAARYAPNRGDGRFGALVELDRLDGCGAVAVGDVTGDGREELLVAHRGNPYQATLPQGDLTWYSRHGRAWTRRGRIPVGRVPSSITVTDVSGDRVNDVIVEHDWDNSPPVVLPGSRAGLRALDPTLHPPATAPTARVTGRLDGDDVGDTAEVTTSGTLRLSRTQPVEAPTIREISGTPVIVPPQPARADAAADGDAADDDGDPSP